jgi:tetratricopeptide (TPR) repeat protein
LNSGDYLIATTARRASLPVRALFSATASILPLIGSSYAADKDYEEKTESCGDSFITPRNVYDSCLATSRGVRAIKEGDYSQAIQAFTDAIKLDQNNSSALNNRGFAYRRTGDNDSAISDFKAAIRINPKFAFAYFNLGVTWLSKGDYDQAITSFSAAIQFDSKDAHARNSRGTAYELKGDAAHAIEDLKTTWK